MRSTGSLHRAFVKGQPRLACPARPSSRGGPTKRWGRWARRPTARRTRLTWRISRSFPITFHHAVWRMELWYGTTACGTETTTERHLPGVVQDNRRRSRRTRVGHTRGRAYVDAALEAEVRRAKNVVRPARLADGRIVPIPTPSTSCIAPRPGTRTCCGPRPSSPRHPQWARRP